MHLTVPSSFNNRWPVQSRLMFKTPIYMFHLLQMCGVGLKLVADRVLVKARGIVDKRGIESKRGRKTRQVIIQIPYQSRSERVSPFLSPTVTLLGWYRRTSRETKKVGGTADGSPENADPDNRVRGANAKTGYLDVIPIVRQVSAEVTLTQVLIQPVGIRRYTSHRRTHLTRLDCLFATVTM